MEEVVEPNFNDLFTIANLTDRKRGYVHALGPWLAPKNGI
jgi:hypothetical protein